MSGAPSRQGPATLPDAEVRARSVLKYRKRATGYDATCGPTWPIRERTVAADIGAGVRKCDSAGPTALADPDVDGASSP